MVPGVRSAGTEANVHLIPHGSPYGLAGRWFQDAVRTLGWSTGSPNSQSFTFVARVRANLAPTAPGVIARSGTSATSFSGNTIPLWRATTSFDMRVNGTDYTAAGTWNLEQWYDIAIIGSAAACQLWVGTPESEAQLVINGAAATSGTIESFFGIGDVSGGSMAANGLDILHILWANRPWGVGQLLEFNHNPWAMLFDPEELPYFFTSGGGATNLTIQDALHAHTADALTLTQQHVLVVADASHAHLADGLTLTQQHVLAIADALHAHAADNIVLSVEGTLAIADALHAHTADSLTLTQQHVLAVADALHAHLADNLTLVAGGTTLEIADALHAHLADGIALTQLHILTVSDALHAHLADSLTLSVPGAAILHNRVLLVRGENRTLVILPENRTLTVH